MHLRMKMVCALGLAAALAIGCGGSPGSAGPTTTTHPATTTDPANAGGAEASGGDVPDGAKFVCHLICSGTETSGYGATEEDAHADAARHIEHNCKPEDGQYFIVCDPLP